MSPVGVSLNPAWLHFAGIFAIILSIIAGLTRSVLLDWSDPIRCGALINRGSWLDAARKNWQPDGCMLHAYTPTEGSVCLKSKEIIFLGDSVTRKLFYQLAHILDPLLPTAPPDDEHKHSDHKLRTELGTQVSFFWDPYLNSSHMDDFIVAPRNGSGGYEARRPALLVLGSGLWYLRYANTSGGLPSWEANMERIVDSLASSKIKPADEVIILPVEQVVASKLSHERAISMHSSDIDAMNSDLYHRVHPLANDLVPIFSNSPPTIPIAFPLVFNSLLDPSLTEDGLHFSDSLIRIQANILLNLRCNDLLPKTFPLDKTCCSNYPRPSVLQLMVLGTAILWGPIFWFLLHRQRNGGSRWSIEYTRSILMFSAAIALIYIADRTGIWLKEQKQFSAWTFGFLSLVSLAIGLVTVKSADKDLGFLNREQTDEWKGWMQIAILIYHYCGASKISGIYNPIRVLVASYLFMTGYGHTTFYLRKADFGFLRIAQVMVRLNLLTLLLAYTMNTDYISYYFAPLVSMWFLIIYATMAIGSQLNDRTAFLVCKFLLSAGLITWFMSEPWLLETLFDFLRQVFGIKWSAREWAFRVNLDLWIVYVGMFASLAVIKARENRLTDHPNWPLAVKVAVGASSITILWFFGFELWQETKFAYNAWHPYVSFLPVMAFIVLRNANAILRSASSRFFAFIGRCSLETFIIQYHLWLAGDTKGILLVIPSTHWRPVNFVITTVMFIYVSDRVAHATTDITAWICPGVSQVLPLPTTAATLDVPPFLSSRQTRNHDSLRPDGGPGISIPLTSPNVDHIRKDDEGNPLPPEPDTPIRARRWVDRLAEGTELQSRTLGFQAWYGEDNWKPGVKTKLTIALGVMWFVNRMWDYL